MRKDPALDFGANFAFEGIGLPGRHFKDGVSHSGLEPNRLFLSRGGTSFVDASGISGADDRADGRAFTLLDFDRDGRQDLATANANAPLLRLYRNEMPMQRHGFAAVRLVGANRAARSDPRVSNRDGVGALVEVTVGTTVLLREHRAGESFAAQNSATLQIGIGESERADQVQVRWPSGATQQFGPVASGSLVTLYEDPEQSPDGSGSDVAPYASAGAAPLVAGPAGRGVRSSGDEIYGHLSNLTVVR